jgi:hypothetical protein
MNIARHQMVKANVKLNKILKQNFELFNLKFGKLLDIPRQSCIKKIKLHLICVEGSDYNIQRVRQQS